LVLWLRLFLPFGLGLLLGLLNLSLGRGALSIRLRLRWLVRRTSDERGGNDQHRDPNQPAHSGTRHGNSFRRPPGYARWTTLRRQRCSRTRGATGFRALRSSGSALAARRTRRCGWKSVSKENPSSGSAGGLVIDLAGTCARRSRDLSEAESCHLSSRQVSWLAGGGLDRTLPIDARSVDSGRRFSVLLTRLSEPRLQWRYRVGISPTSLFSRDGHLDEYCCG